MISVSVARSVRGPGTDPEVIRLAATGHWPYRNEDDYERLLEHADVLLAVGRGLVVGADSVTGEPVVHNATRLVEFTLEAPPQWAVPLVGTPAPDELTSSRGARLETTEQRLTVRGHQLCTTASGHLIVRPAQGCSVTVRS